MTDFNAIVDELARSLCIGRLRNDSVFVSTAVTYPNGTGVTVRIDKGRDGFSVSDDGYAEVIAEEMGALAALRRIANGVAERAGAEYDRGTFIIHDVERNTLPVAVTIVANASSKALERVNASLEQPRQRRSRDVFNKRLEEAFGGNAAFDVEFEGLTGKKWSFSAGLYRNGVFERLFELVSSTTQSVALAHMKISDSVVMPSAPSITAALVDYDQTEPALRAILSNSGGIVIAANDDIAKYRLTSAR